MLIQDIRSAVRSLLHARGVTLIIVACLSLGIGINATLFSVVDGILIQPLPYVEPDRLLILNETNAENGVTEAGVSHENLRDWRQQTTTFSHMAGAIFRSITLSDGGEAERYQGNSITWELFPMLGVSPAVGRHFGPDDDQRGAEPVVIISDDVWRLRYNRIPSIIGRSVLVNARPHTIVGVMPPRFAFPENTDVWIPHGPIADREPRSNRSLFAIGRIKPGVGLQAARADLVAITARLAVTYPQTNEGWSAMAQPLADDFIPDDVRLIVMTMMGAVTLVLLIACANVANLMLARASGRQREFAVRASLGAGRVRLVRQLLTECLMLGVISFPLGLAIAYLGIWMLDNAVPPDMIPYYIHWEMSPRGIAYTMAISALTGLVFGLVPATQAGRLNLQEVLRDGARGAGTSGRRARLRNSLVVAEVALTLVLLVGASLFVRSFLNLQGASPGFDTAPLLTLRFYMAGDGYAKNEAMAQRVDDVVRRIEALPGVEAMFASNFIPLGGGGGGAGAIVDGRPVPPGKEPFIGFTTVTSRVRHTLGLPLLQGRDFTDAEGRGEATVAVINQTMAAELWPDVDPIGRRFRQSHVEPPKWFTVIGVMPDIEPVSLNNDEPPLPMALVPYPHGPSPNVGLTIRAANPAGLAAAVRAAVRAADPALAIFDVQTMETLRTRGFWQFRLFGQMFGIFGAAALILAAIGVYGVLSFSVSQRRQEMGVRMALGAQQSDVRRLVVGQGVGLALVGIAVGLVGAFAITRVIASLLYNVTPTDPLSFAAVSMFLIAVGSAASYFPARRATAVDPVVALRNE